MSSSLDSLVGVFKALADPTRLRLAALIVDRARCGQELAAELGISTPTVSHHLRLLRAAGLIREVRQTPYTFFELDHGALQAAVRAVSDKRVVREIADDTSVPAEERKVLSTFFDGPRLTAIPAARRKKEIVFEEILRRLPRRKDYGEKELSLFLSTIHPDFCTIRREFIMGRYMVREAGRYQLAERGRAVVEGR
jgi:biotin operon repressor